jgi:hypothetical protein
MSKIFLASLLLILCVSLTSANEKAVLTILDSNINELVGDGFNCNWLIMFYLESCPHCKNAKLSIENLSKNKAVIENPALDDLKIGIVECNVNNWSCMRFDIKRVPQIIHLKDNKLFDFNAYVTEEKLLSFITEEKVIENAKEIPNQLGMLSVVKKVFEESVTVLNEQIKDLLANKFNIQMDWTTHHTIGVLIAFLILIIFIEYIIIFHCCEISKNKKQKKCADNDCKESHEEHKSQEEAKPKSD